MIIDKFSENLYRLYNQLLWEKRKVYIDFLESYLRGEIDAEKVRDDFLPIYYKHQLEIDWLMEDPERVKTSQIDAKSEGFDDLLDSIFWDCEALDLEKIDDNSRYSLSENSFRKYIGLKLQQLKEYD